MKPEFRQRVLLPVILPLLLLGFFFAFAFSLSRVFLAVPSGSVATLLALLVAGYILAVAGTVSARPAIPSRALGLGLVIGLAAIVVAGTLGASAGMREVHPAGEEPQAEGGGEEGGSGEGGGGQEFPEDALVFVTNDTAFQEAPETAEAGELEFALDNQDSLPHDVTIEEEGDEVVVEADGGETDTGTIELEPGTYTYYCGVAGHRQAGMEGTLEVQ